MILQIVRRGVQVATLVVLVAIAVLSLYGHYRAARVVGDAQLMAGLRGAGVVEAIDPYLSRLGDSQALLDANKGTLWSLRLMGVDFTDPLAAAEVLATAKHVHGPLLASIVIPLALTVLLGRVFCSWICPGYLLFELTGKLRRLLRWAEIQPGEVKFAHANKYVFLLIGLVVGALASKPLFALIYPPAVISRTIHAWIFGTALTGMIILMVVIVGIEVFISPRWWCRTMCPGGALYALLGWARPVRVKLKADRCTGCRACIPVCEAGIDPITQSSSLECDNCGVCLRHCDRNALVFTIGLPDLPRRGALNPKRIGAASALLLLLVAAPAPAHHILGLPHYSYKENYPQRPTLEYPATAGPYEVLLTSYPGDPIPTEPANLAFYIKDTRAGGTYPEPITVRVLQTSTFADNAVVMPPTTRAAFDNEYKFRVTFPDRGEYVVELTLVVEGRTEVIPFHMVAGAPTATASIVIAALAAGVAGFVAIRAVQIKRRRTNRVAKLRALPLQEGPKSCRV